MNKARVAEAVRGLFLFCFFVFKQEGRNGRWKLKFGIRILILQVLAAEPKRAATRSSLEKPTRLPRYAKHCGQAEPRQP